MFICNIVNKKQNKTVFPLGISKAQAHSSVSKGISRGDPVRSDGLKQPWDGKWRWMCRQCPSAFLHQTHHKASLKFSGKVLGQSSWRWQKTHTATGYLQICPVHQGCPLVNRPHQAVPTSQKDCVGVRQARHLSNSSKHMCSDTSWVLKAVNRG